MKVPAFLHTVLLLAALAGCAATPKSITEAEIRREIKVTTGDLYCPSCDRLKTYTSPTVLRVSTHYSDTKVNGYLEVKINLVATNVTEGHAPGYQLVAEFTNSGDFADSADLFFPGGERLIRVGDQQGRRCWNNFGNGCTWTQAYAVSAARVEKAVASGGIDLFVGRQFEFYEKVNDGYGQRQVLKTPQLGLSATIPHDAIAGFVHGLQDKGAELPNR